MEPEGLDRLFRDRRLNAAISWGLIVFLLVVAAVDAAVGQWEWGLIAVTIAVLALLPGLAYKSRSVMLPWEVLLIAALPVLGRTLATQELTGTLATYLSIAALALIVAVQLHIFGGVRMTVGFAMLFVVVTTLASAGVWAVVRWQLDMVWGTGFIQSEEALMIEFTYAAAAGIIAAVVYEYYFRRRVTRDDRLPSEVVDELPEDSV